MTRFAVWIIAQTALVVKNHGRRYHTFTVARLENLEGGRLPTSGTRMNVAASSKLPPGGKFTGSHTAATDPVAIRAQLERILASAPFRNSKRYPALLRYVVERALNGASSELKERNIGIDVFGREPSYDLSADPVVRISAGEVRKRLAQYYQEAAQPDELRIDLPLGSYQPEFVAPAAPPPVPSEIVAQPPLPAASPAAQNNDQSRKIGARTVALGLAALCLILGLVIFRALTRPTALDLFWRPVITPGNTVTLCVGHGAFVAGDASGSFHAIDRNEAAVAWWDAETLARLAGLIQAKGAALRLLREDHATFSDFQQNASVLIGAYNDQWTLELMQKMRYTFKRTGDVQWIADRDRPSFRDWRVDLAQKDSQGDLAINQDYAIISRVVNPRTGFMTVTVAGLWGYGTLAAGRFLTQPKYLREAARGIRSGWSNRDMQFVIGTEVIRGSSGPPKVLATAFW